MENTYQRDLQQNITAIKQMAYNVAYKRFLLCLLYYVFTHTPLYPDAGHRGILLINAVLQI